MDRRLALPDPPAELRVRTESLRARVSEALETVDFREGLKPDWRVDDPLGVSLGADGLRIRTNGDRRELHRPVTWRGGHARLRHVVAQDAHHPIFVACRRRWGLQLLLCL